jgi:DNA-binding SARP family transcriptional activator
MHLHLASAPRVTLANGTAQPLAALDAALLAWLAIEGPTPRARMAALLWPEKDADSARNSLRQRLFKLRRTVGVELVGADATVLALAEGIEHDLHEAGGVLADVAIGVPGEFADWLALQRHRRRDRVRGALVELSEGAERARDWDDALSHAHELLALDPLSEEAHRRVMRLHYLRGDRAAALLAFDRCEQLLKDEVSTPPSAETMALLVTVQSAAPNAELPRARQVPASLLRPPRLVGREQDWTSLEDAWQRRQPALLLGEAGVGKSRLLDDFARSRAVVLQFGARPGDERVAYATASRLLRCLPQAALRALPQGVRNCLAGLLPELGKPVPLHDEAARTRLFNACATALTGAAEGIEACALDDLQYADAASIELMRFLVGTLSMRWFIASRPADPGLPAFDWIQLLLTASGASVVRLAPLGRDDVAALVESLDLPPAPVWCDANQLHRHTGGNPLFVLETVKACGLEAGARLDPVLRTAPSALALIDQRIRQLSPEAVRLARCAAVAGPDFSTALAVHVTGRRAIDLADPWAELEAAQVLCEGAFAHDLIYEAARASVPASVAGYLHADIASFLEAHGGEPVRIADHWNQAQCWPQAALAYRAAAVRSYDAGRDAEQCALLASAADCFERAGDETGRFEALLARAQQLVTKDFSSEVVAEVDRLQGLAATEAQRLDALVVRLILADNRHEHSSYLEEVSAAVETARALGRRDLEFELVLLWSAALRQLARPSECAAVLDGVRSWVETEGDVVRRWRLSAELELVLDRCGRMQEAVSVSQRTVSLARETQRRDWAWMSLTNAASLLCRTGRVAEGCTLWEEALREAAAAGDGQRSRVVQEQTALAARLRDLGHYARALPVLETGLELFESAQMVNDVALAQLRLGLLYVFLGQPARARPLLADQAPSLLPGVALVREVLRVQLDARPAGEAVAAMRTAVARYGNPTDAFHMLASLWAAQSVADDEGEAMAAAIANRAMREGRIGLAMGAHVRAAARAADQAAWRRAAVHVEFALTLSVDHGPDNFYLPELWCTAARVAQGSGQVDAARRHVETALCWVRKRLENDVPPTFRDSFLHRNRINAELIAWPQG